MTRRLHTQFDVPGYYHVYNRGAGKRTIFEDAQDKAKFIALMARYLDDKTYIRGDGVPYEKSEVKLLAYCLMGNHFHLFLYQDIETTDIQLFIKSLSSSYARYYNLKYRKSGYLFEGQFKAKQITSDTYFDHITRYIHLNPRTYKTYKWSSLPEYTGGRVTPWVHTTLASQMSPEKYMQFIESYENRAKELRKLKEVYDLQ